MARPKSPTPRDSFANVRLTTEEREEIENTALALGLKSISEYVRHLHKLHKDGVEQNRALYEVAPQAMYNGERLRPYFSTKRGQIYQGDSLDFLHSKAEEKSIDLIMTSPPFGLVRKKSYGNEDADDYCDWFRPFAEGFRRVLKDSGSLVIDIGGAWKPGMPTRSLYHFELLMMLCREYGFHLCQEHFWWNPSKLPSARIAPCSASVICSLRTALDGKIAPPWFLKHGSVRTANPRSRQRSEPMQNSARTLASSQRTGRRNVQTQRTRKVWHRCNRWSQSRSSCPPCSHHKITSTSTIRRGFP